MNFTQLQERVRLELLRRIERGTVSVSLLARQTGLGQGHISNFLRSRRQLSLGTLDKIMNAQRISVPDLLPAGRDMVLNELGRESGQIPLVSYAVALHEPYIRASSVQRVLTFPAETIGGWRPLCTPSRKQWERFVAVRVGGDEARAMEPLIQTDALVVLDRHYNSFKPYRDAAANVYGVRVGSRLSLRYAEFTAHRLVLRPQGLGFPVEVIAVGDGEIANDYLVGRVALVQNEL